MQAFFMHRGGDDDDKKKPQSVEPLVETGDYDPGDSIGEKIGEHEADQSNV